MSSVFKKSLGDLLVEQGIVDREHIDEAIKLQMKSGKKLGKILQEKGLLEEETLYSFLETQLGVPFKTQIDENPEPELFIDLPLRYCKKKVIAPVKMTSKKITVYISEPTNTSLVNEISFMTGRVVDLSFATEGAIMEYLNRMSGADSRKITQKTPEPQPEEMKEDITEENSPVVKLVQETIHNAIDRNTSDIHFENYEKQAFIRFRIDGMLVMVEELDKKMLPAIISRIKIMSELDISEKRLPQDGRIMMDFPDRKIDIRVSIIPTAYGENAVLRILDKGRQALTIYDIGFSEVMLDNIRKEAKKPYGMVLVTGPTGSGKTTTLYALLQYILGLEEKKILTIEDPVEYQVDGVSQVQVHSEIGLTFAAGLRAFLRHDPDVMMVGEIRDRETAEIAVRAALTGHLVLSTVHTNDAASSLTRFVDMSIPAYLLTSTINLVIAQRLVRKICPKCKDSIILDGEQIDLYDISDYFKAGDKVYYGKGCKKCNKTGYQGRTPIFEMMKITENIKKAILRGESSFELKDIARQEGMMSLRDSGIQLVKQGITTIEEIEKIVALGD